MSDCHFINNKKEDIRQILIYTAGEFMNYFLDKKFNKKIQNLYMEKSMGNIWIIVETNYSLKELNNVYREERGKFMNYY